MYVYQVFETSPSAAFVGEQYERCHGFWERKYRAFHFVRCQVMSEGCEDNPPIIETKDGHWKCGKGGKWTIVRHKVHT